MALSGHYLTIRLQSHSSGTANEVIAETTSINCEFNAEALETTDQADAAVSNFIGGKNTIQISGDWLAATDNEQFELLFVHQNAGADIEVELYRNATIMGFGFGQLTSLSNAGANSDTLTTGSYAMELDYFSFFGDAISLSTLVNDNYTTFSGASSTGFSATSDGGGLHHAGTVDEIAFVSGFSYLVEFTFVLNSGTAPTWNIRTALGGTNIGTVSLAASPGANSFIFTANQTTTGVIDFFNISTTTDYEVSNLSIKGTI